MAGIPTVDEFIAIHELFSSNRTNLYDFLKALEAVDDRLAKYEPVKQGAWTHQSRWEHTKHMRDHFDAYLMTGKIEELTAAILRGLMLWTIQTKPSA